MTFGYLTDILIAPSETLSDALRAFEHNARHTSGIGIVLVVDERRRLQGIATEGDVRRALLDGQGLDTPVARVMEKSPTVARIGSSKNQLLQLFDRQIRHVPLVDDEGIVHDLVLYQHFQVIDDDEQVTLACRAPLRISFAGGGSDLSLAFSETKGAVVSGTIDAYAHAILQSRTDTRIRLECADTGRIVEVDGIGEFVFDSCLDLHKAAIRLLRPQRGFTLRTWTDVPIGSGLGTSSSLMVAVIGAVGRYSRREMGRAQIADLAFQAERIELGLAGGWQDQYASAFGGINLIEFDRSGITVTPISLDDGAHAELEAGLVLCRVTDGRNSSIVQQLSQAGGVMSLERAAAHSQAAHDCLRALVRGELQAFAAMLTQAWERKRQLGGHISTPEIDRLFQIAMGSGALGGKLVGAGGGGHLLFYANQARVKELMVRLGGEGYFVFQPTLRPQGVECWRTASTLTADGIPAGSPVRTSVGLPLAL